MSAFLFCFAAWSAIALGMERHHEDALGRPGTARRLLWLRRAGWLLLLFSMWLAAQPSGGMALSLAALAVTASLTWQPRRTPALAGAALATGLWTWAV
jgi:hypothetical protein